MSHPWDKLPEETDAYYAQFLCYLNLGVRRNLHLAYDEYLSQFDAERQAVTGPSGAFKAAYYGNRWKERAEAWDVWRLRTYGARVAVLYTQALENMVRKLEEASEELDYDDAGYERMLDTAKFVADQLKPAREAGALQIQVVHEHPARPALPEHAAAAARPDPSLADD